jgi:hypothetical protein
MQIVAASSTAYHRLAILAAMRQASSPYFLGTTIILPTIVHQALRPRA